MRGRLFFDILKVLRSYISFVTLQKVRSMNKRLWHLEKVKIVRPYYFMSVNKMNISFHVSRFDSNNIQDHIEYSQYVNSGFLIYLLDLYIMKIKPRVLNLLNLVWTGIGGCGDLSVLKRMYLNFLPKYQYGYTKDLLLFSLIPAMQVGHITFFQILCNHFIDQDAKNKLIRFKPRYGEINQILNIQNE